MACQAEILGSRIDCFPNYQSFFLETTEQLKEMKSGAYVTVNNVHTIMESYWDDTYNKILNSALFSIPDGMPLAIMSKFKKHIPVCRLFGPSVMEYFIDKGRLFNHKHFFLGSSLENLNKLRESIEIKYPGTIIAGMISPPFESMSKWDNESFIQQINDVSPDFIWIGLGAPKQERWMFEHAHKINRGILFGIGAAFNYLIGNTKHAPIWMKKISLEWLYRLFQEPKRLWKRYLTTIPPFMILAIFDLSGISFKRKHN